MPHEAQDGHVLNFSFHASHEHITNNSFNKSKEASILLFFNKTKKIKDMGDEQSRIKQASKANDLLSR